MINQILVPLDGSKTAEKILPFVMTEARLHEAEVILLRVVAPLRQSLMASPSIINQAYKQIDHIAKDYLEIIAEKLQTEGLIVNIHVGHGSPALRILEIAIERDCDLIMIGTHGETSSLQWRFGSVANKIIKAKSNIPLMVVPTLDNDLAK